MSASSTSPTSAFDTVRSFTAADGSTAQFHSLPALEAAGVGPVSRLPVSLRIVLESLLRHCDGHKITADHIRELANWQPNAPRTSEIPFVVARVVLQDFTGVPLLADLAAMRNVAVAHERNPKLIEPQVPVDLVIDHSVQVDFYGRPDALQRNMEIEFTRNHERYQFLKWGMQAFDTFRVVPPGIGIVHQVNLEHFFPGVHCKDKMCYPDTLVGTDSHTPMINGLGVVGWGVGGIEAEAAMLGQPVYLLTPDVIGVELLGKLPEGATSTDLVLTITEMLRREKVVNSFVEFFGEGTAGLTVTDRATIGNMAPENGATICFFPVDEETVAYMRATGRTEQQCAQLEAYFRAQQMFGMPRAGDITYTRTLTLDLASIVPSLAGPSRPQDRIELTAMRRAFEHQYSAPVSENGFGRNAYTLDDRFSCGIEGVDLGHGDVLIAAITSCTNTSNPPVMLAAGLLAKKALERGLSVQPHVKTSLAPGSRVVTDYLEGAGLLEPLAALGFALAGYGCTTCIGNSGPLAAEINDAIFAHDLVAAAVLSGNRNFEARIHPSIRANYLASPPLVVAFAIAGRANIDLSTEPLGTGRDGEPVYLRDIWPSSAEIEAMTPLALNPELYRKRYADFVTGHDLWNAIKAPVGQVYEWPQSTYIARPPFFDDFSMQVTPAGDIHGARALALFGDSVTTDHISPAGSFRETTPAGKWLVGHGVKREDFNSYGSRRGHHELMVRATFANVLIKNQMLPPNPDGSRVEGGYALFDGQQTTIFEAAEGYRARGTPTVVFAGEEYGTGSSRDWAAKGTLLLGVKAVIAKSFERIHRSNLIGMGVLPLQFKGKDGWAELGINGEESFDILGLGAELEAQQDLTLRIHRADGRVDDVAVLCRIDTPVEVDYFHHGGIMPYVLRQTLNA